MLFYGALISPTSLTAYTAAPHALVSVSNDTGVIEWVEEDVPAHTLQDTLAKHGVVDTELTELKRGEFLMPGLIDTHTHAPQVPNAGLGQEYELLDWLAQITFPMEARYKDPAFARRVYESVVRRFIDCGTTTCCYYGTLHLEATKILADIVHSSGQRAFVGKCNMDRNSPPTYVEASVADSVADTRALIAYIRGLSPDPRGARVQPILTPRFAISCTPELLGELGALASADPALAIQTHISENPSEIAFTKELFPADVLPGASKASETTYAGVYDAFGLLRSNTVLAHAVHLEPSEVELIRTRQAGISHCPTSNFNLRSGCAHVGELLDAGIKVGLGTDVSGGFSSSILNAVQNASIASKVIAMQQTDTAPLQQTFATRHFSIATLLHLATQGGADVCGLGTRIGSLVPGKAFDALVVSLATDANPGAWSVALDDALGIQRGGEGPGVERRELESLLERFLFTGDDRNIRRVYVDGRCVGGVEFSR